NRRHSARQSRDLPHVGGINPELFEILDCGRAEQVAADTGHHEYVRAAQFRSDCLIGALAAESEVELLPENGLARFRELVSERRQVDIATSHYRDARTLGHWCFPEKCEERRVYSARRSVSTWPAPETIFQFAC